MSVTKEGGKISSKKEFNKEVNAAFGDKADKAAPANKESVNQVITGVPTLNAQYDGFEGKVNINISGDFESTDKETLGAVAITYPHNGELNGNPHITLFGASFETYRYLARTLFHEFLHVQDFRSGQIFNDFIRICGGSLSASQARQSALYLSEIRAYREGLRVTGQPLTPGYSKAANYLTEMGIGF